MAPPAARPTFDAIVFDMDGVVTRTATLHAVAWKELFDEFLRERAARSAEPFQPFDENRDYRAYVDGKPRHDGVRSFLDSRGIGLPEGDPADPPGSRTVHALAARKDASFERRLEEQGVDVYESTLALIESARARGLKTALVTSSRHGRHIVEKAGIALLFDALIDGNDAASRNLRGKPQPDTFLAAVADVGATAGCAVVVEDAVAGVAAGRAGAFGLVVGVDRGGNRRALERYGADVVVEDLGELDFETFERHYTAARQRISWRVEQEGFDAARERDVESLFTLANGYLGVRGALDTPVPVSQGDLFIAGVYDRKQAVRPYSEHEFLGGGREDYAHSELVSFPFPFQVRFTLDGRALSLVASRWSTHRRVLDMRAGVLQGEIVYEVGPGLSATVNSRRCASLADLHLLLQEITFCLENHSAALEADLSLQDADLATNHPHLVQIGAEVTGTGIEVREYATQVSGVRTCIAQRAMLAHAGEEGVAFDVPAAIGERLCFRRYVAVYTSRDGGDPRALALAALAEQSFAAFDAAFEAHAEQWAKVWERADVQVPGVAADEQALRFHAYHLSSAADHDPHVSVGARALTGRAYEGHVFWDVEVFMLPFFLHTRPDVARHLLAYRHATLDGAREHARELGQEGACFAWESTVTGEDVTPRVIVLRTTQREVPIFTGTQQIHVTAGVAYGIWRYWQATRDADFLRHEGAEILAETARFWASRARLDGGSYHIRGVVGPDEYHHDVDDNAYTNWMARFNLDKAVWLGEWLEREHPRAWAELRERIGLEAGEQDRWAEVALKLHVPQPNADGVIEQFAGFFDLEDYPLPAEERFKAPIDRLFDWDRINGLKLLKQADVLMLPFLFPERFDREQLAANYRYYEPLTDHGSSLSPGVHAALAARLGLEEQAERYLRQSLTLDLTNVMGNSTLGVHAACMGATWQALVLHFLGVRFGDDGPVIEPEAAARLPARWRSVALSLRWRGRSYPVEVSR